MLHQANRARDDIGQIVADIDDYVVARELVATTIAESVGSTISDTVRQTVDAVAELAAREGVSVHAVTDKLQLDKSNAGRRLRVAADGGYVRIIGDPYRNPVTYCQIQRNSQQSKQQLAQHLTCTVAVLRRNPGDIEAR
jgi:hypothetical protein